MSVFKLISKPTTTSDCYYILGYGGEIFSVCINILCYWYRYFLIFQQVYLERFENDGHSDSETDSDDEKPLSELKQSIVLSRYLTPSHRQLPCSDQEVTPREGLFTPQVRVTPSFYPCLSMLLLVR